MRCIEILHSIQNGENGVRLIETWDVLKLGKWLVKIRGITINRNMRCIEIKD